MSFVSVEDEISIENFTLTVYSQDTNIVTSERLINKTILKLLEKADQERKLLIIINEPKTKESNQRILFKAIATALMDFDDKKNFNNLQKIFFKWDEENLAQFRN